MPNRVDRQPYPPVPSPPVYPIIDVIPVPPPGWGVRAPRGIIEWCARVDYVERAFPFLSEWPRTIPAGWLHLVERAGIELSVAAESAPLQTIAMDTADAALVWRINGTTAARILVLRTIAASRLVCACCGAGPADGPRRVWCDASGKELPLCPHCQAMLLPERLNWMHPFPPPGFARHAPASLEAWEQRITFASQHFRFLGGQHVWVPIGWLHLVERAAVAIAVGSDAARLRTSGLDVVYNILMWAVWDSVSVGTESAILRATAASGRTCTVCGVTVPLSAPLPPFRGVGRCDTCAPSAAGRMES